jgi:hypothetical protein
VIALSKAVGLYIAFSTALAAVFTGAPISAVTTFFFLSVNEHWSIGTHFDRVTNQHCGANPRTTQVLRMLLC